MTAATALRLPRVARALVATNNRMHQAKAELTLPGVARLHLRLAPDDTRPGPGPAARVEGRMGGERFVLHAPWRLVADLVGGFAPDVSLDPLPGALRGLMLEASLQDGVEFLEEAAGRTVALNTIGDAGDAVAAAGHPIGVGWGEDWVVWLDCSARLWDEVVSGWPAAAWDLDGMTVPATAQVGRLALSKRVLASLRPGDVLLGQDGIDTQSGRLVLAGGFGADMVKVAENWLLTEAPATMQHYPSNDTEEDAADGGEADLADIPVRLAFDIGHLDLPLSRLREMDAGTILDLQRGTAEFVGITANGRRIGRGELVDIEGTLGVRITRIFGRE